ncbi:MAG: hypothetical protein DLM59_04870 [Pseudonocardiales bacterium]|nr:MAG: hypothetical protein DLM59_04870 [Pseudonocardiales bacterium]
MSTAGVVGAALGSALAAAASSVLQHRSARNAPRSIRNATLVAYLLSRPGWLVGSLCAVVGLVLHAVALAGGRLALVQPLLVSGLLFALPVSVLLEHRRPRVREWLWAFAVVVGLSAFLLGAHPGAGRSVSHGRELGITTAACLALIGILVVVARSAAGARAALLATAGGLGFGITSALLKQAAGLAAHRPLSALTDWSTYGLIVVGALAVGLTQVAYRSGRLADALPAMTISDPASSIFIGVIAFHERVGTSPAALTVQVLAFVLMTVAARQVALVDT